MIAESPEPPRDCPLCPRLAAFRAAQRLAHPEWFNAPVPGFGDPLAWLAIVGLAPGLQGANRTGRPFTGDFAGVLLYQTLLKFGLAEGSYEARPDDGLVLKGAMIVNAVRCVPPQNKPTPEEIRTCRRFLVPALDALPNLRVVVALGQIAHQSAVKALGGRLPKARFGHGAEHALPSGATLIDSYHCSRYNQNTRVLSAAMFEQVFERALALGSTRAARLTRGQSQGDVVIRQVAALPYRTEPDGSTSVLLITSRETRRWVVPKGNLIAGLEPHLAAAHEAFTEAGVSGNPAQVPIGFYRYAKRRKNGIHRTMTVDVFPLGVTAQADEWPEQDERELRWCKPAEAADAVQEEELKSILAAFRAPAGPGTSTPFRNPLRARARGKGPFGWFQALLPSQGRFFELFEAHAALLVAGAEALARMLEGGDGIDAQVREIMVREQQADDVTRDVLQDVRRIFVTPFDRSAITGLIGAMDDAIDQMNETAKAIAIFEVRAFEPQMRAMSAHIVHAARTIAEAIPLIRSVASNAERLNALTARVVAIEGDAEEANDTGIRDLFRACQGEPMRFIVGQEIYSHLGRIADRFEDVANEVQGLVIDHA